MVCEELKEGKPNIETLEKELERYINDNKDNGLSEEWIENTLFYNNIISQQQFINY